MKLRQPIIKDDPRLLSEDGLLKDYSIRKQASIKRLNLLNSAGIPAVYSTASKGELLFMFNLLMYRALHGYFENVKPSNQMEYSLEALRTFRNVQKLANRIMSGARPGFTKPAKPIPLNSPVVVDGSGSIIVHCRNSNGSVYLPIKTYLKQYDQLGYSLDDLPEWEQKMHTLIVELDKEHDAAKAAK
jgi:hypothetical protein